ncbi:hypothetical protein Q5P01_007725 [Channa striata]|uniref:Uncharacterized protein n=1 Tax=Channa striata TaxID=64152 RepID=A0AA88N8T5_CHASR|nr:hypothetical protein Q5P01_007725 [Channa striata]
MGRTFPELQRETPPSDRAPRAGGGRGADEQVPRAGRRCEARRTVMDLQEQPRSAEVTAEATAAARTSKLVNAAMGRVKIQQGQVDLRRGKKEGRNERENWKGAKGLKESLGEQSEETVIDNTSSMISA